MNAVARNSFASDTDTCIKSTPSLLGEIIRNLVDAWQAATVLGSIITRRRRRQFGRSEYTTCAARALCVWSPPSQAAAAAAACRVMPRHGTSPTEADARGPRCRVPALAPRFGRHQAGTSGWRAGGRAGPTPTLLIGPAPAPHGAHLVYAADRDKARHGTARHPCVGRTGAIREGPTGQTCLTCPPPTSCCWATVPTCFVVLLNNPTASACVVYPP